MTRTTIKIIIVSYNHYIRVFFARNVHKHSTAYVRRLDTELNFVKVQKSPDAFNKVKKKQSSKYLFYKGDHLIPMIGDVDINKINIVTGKTC